LNAERMFGETAQMLERAGQWLARFADLPDARLKRRMRQRWDEACALAEVAPAALGPIRERYAEAIGG